MKSRVTFLIIILSSFLLHNCKEQVTGPSEIDTPIDQNDPLKILDDIEAGFQDFEVIYFKNIVESNGFNKLWIHESQEIWTPKLVVKDSVYSSLRVYFEIAFSGIETYQKCDNFYTNNCNDFEISFSDTATSFFNFEINEGKIGISFPPHYVMGTDSIPAEINPSIDFEINYDFFVKDSSEIVFENIFHTTFNPESNTLKMNSKNGTDCSFWSFSLSKDPQEVYFDSDEHKSLCRPDVPEIENYFNELFPVDSEVPLEFERNLIALSGWGGEVYGTVSNSTEIWNLKNIIFSEENIQQQYIFDVVSYINQTRTWETYDEDYEPEIIIDTVYSESIITLHYSDNNISFTNHSTSESILLTEIFSEYWDFSIKYDLRERHAEAKIQDDCYTTASVGGGACVEGRKLSIDFKNQEFVNHYFDYISSHHTRRYSYYHGTPIDD